MSKENKISVIIVLYFSKHLLSSIILNLQERIESLGEIILVNNSKENINTFRSDKIKIVYPETNLGYGAAINLGIKNSRFEYLLLLNPDLFISKFDIDFGNLPSLFILSGHNPAMPGYALKFPTLIDSFLEFSISEIVYFKRIGKLIQYKKIKNLSEVHVDYVSGALMFINKATFEKIGGFDQLFFLFYEETDFCKKAANLGIPVISTNRIDYYPKPGKSSSKDVNDIKRSAAIRSCKNYHFRYHGLVPTKITFKLLKSIYIFFIIILTPFALIIEKIDRKRKQLIFSKNFF